MIIAMTQNEDGVWRYHDQVQAELCLFVHLLTGNEITYLDDWLNTDTYWTDDEVLRAKLVRLRHELTATFNKYRRDPFVTKLAAERLFATADKTTLLVAGYKRAEQLLSASRQPRKKDPLREKVLSLMKAHKHDVDNFKTFMSMWQLGHLDGVAAEPIKGTSKYIITDESGDAGSKTYTWGTLEKMFSI